MSYHNSKGTLAVPSRDDCLYSVAKVINRLIMDSFNNHHYNHQNFNSIIEYTPSPFDIDQFIKLPIQVIIPIFTYVYNTYYQIPEINENNIPTVDIIFRFCKTIYDKLQLSSECSIIGLIYIERLLESGITDINSRTWRTICLCSMLISSKVWDDLSSWNIEFADLFPIFTLQSINHLERIYLEGLKYNLFVSASTYAKYYFALRAIRNVEPKDIPRMYLSLGDTTANDLKDGMFIFLKNYLHF